MVSESQLAVDTSIQNVESTPTASRFASRNWLLPLVLIVVPLLLLIIYSKTMFPGLTNTDALDFAQLGRNISAGRGMVTYVLHPLALTHGSNALRQPDVTHSPLFPFLLALAFGAAGARDSVASGVSGLFYLLTVPLLYVLGLRVFNRTVGLITAASFAFSGLMLEYAVSGLHITLYTFLVTALFLVLYNLAAVRKGQRKLPDVPLPLNLLVLAGILTGFLYLTDALFFWLIPVILGSIFWISGSERRRALIAFLLPLAALTVPWMLRNLVVTGNPVFGLRGLEIWMDTGHHYPGGAAYSLSPEEFQRGAYLVPAVIKKILMNLNTVIQTMPQISDTWILAFLLPCLLFGYTSLAATMLRRVMMFSSLALLFGTMVFRINMPIFSCLVPTMLVFAVAYLTHLVKQAKLSTFSLGTVAALLGITIAYPLASQLTLEEKNQPLLEALSAQALSKTAHPREVILSDRPEVVAWYTDRPSIQIPAVDGNVADIRSRFPETRWLFLTPQARRQSPQWQFLYDRCMDWNTAYLEAQKTNSEIPALMRISGDGHPLFDALAGFTSVGPLRGSSPTTVIAVLPEAKLSMDSGHRREMTP